MLGSTNWRIAAIVAFSVVVGVPLAGTGVATAALRPHHFVVVKFVPSANQVTLQIPTPPCRHGPPGCVWRLLVNEPFVPGEPLLGTATGMSGLLTVTYPSTVCGVVQGDASGMSTGSMRWRYKVGHRMTIVCPVTRTAHPPAVTPTAVVTSSQPLTGSPSTSSPPASSHTVQAPAIAPLPFTGIDIKPLALIGLAMVMGGLVFLTTLKGRRRALRWLGYAVQIQAARASRASLWLLGE